MRADFALGRAPARAAELCVCGGVQSLGIEVDGVSYDRAAVAAHATNLANKVKGGLENSLKVGRGRALLSSIRRGCGLIPTCCVCVPDAGRGCDRRQGPAQGTPQGRGRGHRQGLHRQGHHPRTGCVRQTPQVHHEHCLGRSPPALSPSVSRVGWVGAVADVRTPLVGQGRCRSCRPA